MKSLYRQAGQNERDTLKIQKIQILRHRKECKKCKGKSRENAGFSEEKMNVSE
jgi:hypothetical protein